MTINIFVLKGDINGKISVVRFFFVGYIFNVYFGENPIKDPIFWVKRAYIKPIFCKVAARRPVMYIHIKFHEDIPKDY